jgi:hypothetical protein
MKKWTKDIPTKNGQFLRGIIEETESKVRGSDIWSFKTTDNHGNEMNLNEQEVLYRFKKLSN